MEALRPDDLLLSVKQVAETFGVSKVQVTRYHKEGKLPFVEKGRIGCGVIRMTPLSAVKAFVRPKRGRPPRRGNAKSTEKS